MVTTGTACSLLVVASSVSLIPQRPDPEGHPGAGQEACVMARTPAAARTDDRAPAIWPGAESSGPKRPTQYSMNARDGEPFVTHLGWCNSVWTESH